jgi:hypothetical protein
MTRRALGGALDRTLVRAIAATVGWALARTVGALGHGTAGRTICLPDDGWLGGTGDGWLGCTIARTLRRTVARTLRALRRTIARTLRRTIARTLRALRRTLARTLDRLVRRTVHMLRTRRLLDMVEALGLLGALGSLHALGTLGALRHMNRLGGCRGRGRMLGLFAPVASVRRLLDGWLGLRLGSRLEPFRPLLGAMLGPLLGAMLGTRFDALLRALLRASFLGMRGLDALGNRGRGHGLGHPRGDRPRGMRSLWRRSRRRGRIFRTAPDDGCGVRLARGRAAFGLRVRRTYSHRLALRAALVTALARLVAAGSPAKHGAARREPLGLLRLGNGLLLFLERPPDARDIVGIE